MFEYHTQKARYPFACTSRSSTTVLTLHAHSVSRGCGYTLRTLVHQEVSRSTSPTREDLTKYILGF